MHGSRPQESWAVLVLAPHEPDGRSLPIFQPEPPKSLHAAPRYVCGRCRHMLVAGIPIVELKQRAMREEMLIRCPACTTLNATQVIGTSRVSTPLPPREHVVSVPRVGHIARRNS